MRSRGAEPEPTLIPAAEYVRMSDEGQQFSIENQKAAIQEYADHHGFKVVRTYADAGKSGIVLKHREALRELLQDVLSGHATYKAILVYDVSRWGRFLNNDEGAHYEFVCTQAGIPLHYCAETFSNDGTPTSSLLKALKRSMASEFSRELSEKVFRGKSRLVQKGYWVGGQAGYGYRRLMISADGKPKQKMKLGEAKSLITDRVILVPGSQEEIECVRHMFSMAIDGRHGATAIARDLNQKGFTMNGRPWQGVTVKNILTNPKYAGLNVWYRHSQQIRGKTRLVDPDKWITGPETFFPIVDRAIFDRVQVMLPRQADRRWSESEILKRLRSLLKAKGRLSWRLMQKARGMPATSTLYYRLGSCRRIYEMVGYHLPAEDVFRSRENLDCTIRLRRKIVRQILEMFPESVGVTHLPRRSRSILQLKDGTVVSLLLCREHRTRSGLVQWIVQPCRAEREFITLLCRLNTRLEVHSYFLFPCMNMKIHRLGKNDPRLARAVRLRALSEFLAAIETLRTRQDFKI